VSSASSLPVESPPIHLPFAELFLAKPLVDFVIAGAQKAGTTALFDYLGDCDGCNLSKVKEVHYFDDETQDWGNPDHGAYHAQFDWAAPGLKGEATPIYIYWPRALERMAAYNPAMRLVVMLRDPVERAWSHWRMETSRGVETHPFSWCVRQGRARLFDSVPWGVHREFSYIERGFYGEQIDRLFRTFPRDQVLILLADDLRRAPQATLDQVCGFLGLKAPIVTHRDVHVGEDRGNVPIEDAEFLRELYAGDLARLHDLTGISFQA
jgi:Sulfotransferase family